MASILKVDTIQDQAGNNIINENANVITIGASGDTITVPAGATVSGFTSAGIDDNATSTAITITSSESIGIGTASPSQRLHVYSTGNEIARIETNQTEGRLSLKDATGDAILKFRNDYRFTNSSGELARLNSSGNLGIGTTAPINKLHVFNTDHTQLCLEGERPTMFLKETNGNANENFQFRVDGGDLQLQSQNDAQSSASTRLLITQSGNIGIGTSSPNAELHISKSGDADATELILENSFTASGSTDEIIQLQARFGGYDASYIITGKEEDFTTSANRSSYMSFTTRKDGTLAEKMRINSSGQTLIGTTVAPANADTKLMVHTPISSSSRRVIEMSHNTNGANKAGAALGLSIDNGGESTNAATLTFATASGGSLSERMRINNSGNVGIGTSSPDDKLHVTDSSNAELKLQTDNANGGSAIKFNRSGTDYSYIGTKGYFTGTSDNNLYLRANSGLGVHFYTNGNNERMRITSAGSVGIGTTSPIAKLHVDTSNSGVTPNTYADDLFIESSGNTGLTIGSGTSSYSSIYFANSTDNDKARIEVVHSDNSMRFTNNASERMRIDSSGKVLVNTTSNGTESNLNVGGQFGLSSGRGFVFEKQEGANGSYNSVTLQFTTGANGRTCFIETMVGSSGYYLYHVSHRYRGDTPNVLVNQGNGPTISWSVSNSGSNTGSVYTYVVNFPSSTSHPYAKFKVSLGGYITTPITSTSISFA